MNHDPSQLEVVVSRITQRFGAALREWVKEASGSQDMSLEALAEKVQAGLHALGGEIVRELVGLVGTGKTEAPVLCPDCREPMDFVWYRGKWVKTLLGSIRPERCPGRILSSVPERRPTPSFCSGIVVCGW